MDPLILCLQFFTEAGEAKVYMAVKSTFVPLCKGESFVLSYTQHFHSKGTGAGVGPGAGGYPFGRPFGSKFPLLSI